MVLINRGRAATDILQELARSGLDEGVGENHPVHAAITSRLTAWTPIG
jgi:hypothetical protein